MKFYSEKLKRIFDTAAELEEEEKKAEEKAASKQNIMIEVEKQFSNAIDELFSSMQKFEQIADDLTDEEIWSFISKIKKKMFSFDKFFNFL